MTSRSRHDDRVADLRHRLGDRPWSVALIDEDGVSTFTNGVPDEADLEIGSISKGLTALLYVDALERGDVTPDDRLAQHLPRLAGTPVAEVRLASLAVHRSGLPSLPAGAQMTRRTITWLVNGSNPYGDTLEELLGQARVTRLKSTRARYSNLGFQLLGHAVAAAAGCSYGELLRRRVTGPLDLTSAYVPMRQEDLRPDAMIGLTRFGREAEPWVGEALGPAGAVRMTIADLGRLAAALLDGRAPGVDALQPVEDFMGLRIGAAWITQTSGQRTITWHNGGTGGFRSWLGLDRSAGTAVAIVNARVSAPDAVGRRLLTSLA
ncbi:serine hydrolase domain-containing protein [Aeromicrobium sp. CF4.19]|uniref:serine hydrolase domain-containing protein n=1 Tax=Aeromicrobium sp. CF4.19 TaxID=3373082 RepID=UPI003EE490CF